MVEHDELPDDDASLAEIARDQTVFARLTPEDKRRLVDVLTRQGAYVAMIGDGVNDVPAMKRARLAIALGSGSQLAKSVADAVLVSDRFGCIPEAIVEGRRIIRNIQRVAKLFVTKSVFAAFVILTFGLFTGAFPLLPRHVTLAATFTIGIPGFLLALAPGGDRPDSGSFLRSVARFSIPAGVVEGAAVIVAYLAVADVRGHSHAEGATTATTVFVAIGLYLLLVLDAERMEASRGYAAVVVSLSALLGAGYLVVLASPALREFFALELPGVWGLIVTAAVTVGAIRALAWLGLSPYARPPASPPADAAPPRRRLTAAQSQWSARPSRRSNSTIIFRRRLFSCAFSRGLSAEVTSASFSACTPTVLWYGLAALLGQLDQDAAPVIGIGQAADHPGRLQTVEPAGHRAARELHAPRQPARGTAKRRSRLREGPDHLVIAAVQPEFGKRLVHHPLQPPAETADAVDDPLDLVVEIRQDGPDGLQEAVDVVADGFLRHVRKFCQKFV